MDDAREQIARRLCKISITGHRARTDDTPFENSFGQTKKRYRMLAEEVIRQMKWAFSQGIGGPITKEEFYALARTPASQRPKKLLTIAPDDWTPEGKD